MSAQPSFYSRFAADRFYLWNLVALLGVALALGHAAAGGGLLSEYAINALGQFAAFAILALSLDLIWGYLGILSLGHGLFFAIGGYAIAMHLLKHSYLTTGVVPDFMQFMGWKQFPAYWVWFEHFPYAVAAGLLVAFAIALVFGFVSFRSRVNGVYFAIITQALVYVAMLLMFRNDTGFGGNNGMTGFSVVFGARLGQSSVTALLALAAVVTLIATLIGCRALVISRVGAIMIACRDDETRLRTLGYRTIALKLSIWCLSAILAAIAGMLYVPLVGIINPRVLSPELSLEIAVWVAIGGRGRLFGAVIGAVTINAVKFLLSARAPELWPFMLSALIVLVALIFPNGLLDLPALRSLIREFVKRPGARRLARFKGAS